ncbi:hypothetical protein ACFXPS_38750 [Nocardia sp. NPDC059091]|uniref:hypothetical protein n=1 Tax=unclassified Nocardia TaxID=2637762 RepID=UPI0036BE4332
MADQQNQPVRPPGNQIPELLCPSGASVGLKTFISTAAVEIQTAVDLLGIGTTEPPPSVDSPSADVIIADFGEGETSADYQQVLKLLKDRQTALTQLDDTVLQVSNTVAAANKQTFATIMRSVDRLADDLKTACATLGSQTLKPTQESPLILEVSDTVDAVYAQVAQAAEQNRQMAGGGQGGGSTGTGSGGGSGTTSGSGSGSSGSGMMSGLMEMLSMLPMMGISMLPSLLEMLRQNQQNTDKQNADAKNQNGQPAAPAPTPQPDPNTPAATAPNPAGPAPATTDPNAPQPNSPQPNNPQANVPA